MSDPTLVQAFRQALADEPGQRLYAVLDGASNPNLLALLAEHRLSPVCLMAGQLEPELARAAPYLVEAPPLSPFTELLLTRGLGQHWGILATSGEALRALRMHFRRLLSVWSPDGKPLYFRYYDPRVLRVYLPTCNAEELAAVFGPVAAYYAENETADGLQRFTLGAAGLGQEPVRLAQPAEPA